MLDPDARGRPGTTHGGGQGDWDESSAGGFGNRFDRLLSDLPGLVYGWARFMAMIVIGMLAVWLLVLLFGG